LSTFSTSRGTSFLPANAASGPTLPCLSGLGGAFFSSPFSSPSPSPSPFFSSPSPSPSPSSSDGPSYFLNLNLLFLLFLFLC